jgi:hypothetical protein
MDFLVITDFKGVIGDTTLSNLEGDEAVNLYTAESLAISEIDPLKAKFNIKKELSKSDDERNPVLVRILVHITAYYLYNTVEDSDIPERISENYKIAIKDIEKFANGSKSCTLEALLDEKGTTISNYRFGGDPPRNNDIF